MNCKHLGLAAILLVFSHSVFAAVPIVLGTYTGSKTSTASGCYDPALDGNSVSEAFILNITNQDTSGPTVNTISGTVQFAQTDFWYAGTEPFTGNIADDGTIDIVLPGVTYDGIYSNGVIKVDPGAGEIPEKDPYFTEMCFTSYSSFSAFGGSQALDAPVSAGTEIVAGSTRNLQSFVDNTIMPVMHRIKHIRRNLVSDLDAQGRRFDVDPIAGGYKLSGQTGRAAGGDFRNLAGWGSVSYTELENEYALTAYDGERLSFQFGLDYMPNDNMVAGVSFGYEELDVTTTFNQGTLDGQGFTIAPYMGAVIDDQWSFDALVGISTLDYDQLRSSGTISSSTDAIRYFAAANLNHAYAKNDSWLMVSRAGMMIANETTDGFVESDDTVNPERQARLVQAQIGADFTYLGGDQFEPYVNATYNYDLSSSDTNLVGPGGGLLTPFNDNDDLLLGAGFNYYASDSSSASMELRHRVFRDDFEETVFSASYRARF